MDIIQKITEANLCGRGGAGFPTGKKWGMVRDAKGEKKYVIANGSEGEPGVLKDSYLLEKFTEKVVQGVILAMNAVGANCAYLYLRADLYKKYKKKLQLIINYELQITNDQMTITVFREDGKYLNGEETTMLNSIEKKRSEPRFKPPYPTICGLYSCPTLVNNVETFYHTAQIAENKYKNTRFYSLSGKVKNSGVFELEVDLSVDEVLKQTDNYLNKAFFVQVGGGAHGFIYTKEECKEALAQGAGAIVVHDYQEDPVEILKYWTDFFLARNCGQCIPCREGFYRINQLLKESEIDYELIKEILEVMADTSFCGLGQFAPEGYLDFIKKILKR